MWPPDGRPFKSMESVERRHLPALDGVEDFKADGDSRSSRGLFSFREKEKIEMQSNLPVVLISTGPRSAPRSVVKVVIIACARLCLLFFVLVAS